MKILKSTIFIFIIVLTLSSCFKRYNVYGFKAENIRHSWGTLRANVKGTEYNGFFITTLSSPYTLRITFASESSIEGAIEISEIKLAYTDTKRTIFIKNDILPQPIKRYEYNPAYHAFFRFEDIDLEYENVVLWIKYSLIQGDKSTKYDAKINFVKDYQKFFRIIGV